MQGDIAIPVALLLIPFAIFLLLFFFYAFFNVYHLLRFGVYGFHLYIVTAVFVGGGIILLAGSGFLLVDYDWSSTFSLGETLFGGGDAAGFGL